MEMDREVSPGTFCNLSFQELMDPMGEFNNFSEYMALNTPVVPLENEMECTDNPAVLQVGEKLPPAPEVGEEPTSDSTTVPEPVASEPLAIKEKTTDILNEATRQIGWGQWSDEPSQGDNVPAPEVQWYVSDTSTSPSDSGSVSGDEMANDKVAKLKQDMADQKEQLEKLQLARHTLLVVLHNVQERHATTQRDFITASNQASTLELQLTVHEFELMLANTSLEAMTKQLNKAKGIVRRLNTELVTERNQNKHLMHKILALESEVRELEGSNAIPF